MPDGHDASKEVSAVAEVKESPSKPQHDAIETMNESVQLAKEQQARTKHFSMGDTPNEPNKFEITDKGAAATPAKDGGDSKPRSPEIRSSSDGSTMMLDKEGKVSWVAYPTGESRQFKYDKDGKVNEVIEPSGHWKTTDGKNWTNEKNEKWVGTVNVTPDGRYESTQGNVTLTRHPGGQEVTTRDGDIIKSKTSDGVVREYSYNTDGGGVKTLSEIKETRKVTRTVEDDDDDWKGWKIPDEDRKRTETVDETQTWKSDNGYVWKNDRGERREGFVTISGDGTQTLSHNGRDTVTRPDGQTAHIDVDKSVKVERPDGTISETTDAKGQKRSFGYDSEGKLNKVTEEDGTTWSSKDGRTWTTSDNRTWNGTIKVEKDGTYRYRDSEGKETAKYPDGKVHVRESDGKATETLPDGTTKQVRDGVDQQKLDELAETIHEKSRDKWGGGFNDDSEEVLGRLKSMNEREREAFKGAYYKRYGHSLDKDVQPILQGDDQRKQYAELMHNDKDPVAKKADLLMTAMEKSREDYSHLSYSVERPNANKDVRQALSGMNSQEIRELDQYYRDVYGKSLQDVIKSETPTSTRQMCDIYLKGNDHRTVQDEDKLKELVEKEKLDREGDTPDLKAEDMKEHFRDNFKQLDKNKDGFVDEDEIDRAMNDPDYKGKDAQMIAVMKEHRKEIQNLSDDEVGFENDGITKADMDRLSKIAARGADNDEEKDTLKGVEKSLKSTSHQLKESRKLFPEGKDSISPQAVRQTNYGDCWFMATVSGMARTEEGKESIKNMIEDNHDGTYTVTFPGDPKHPVTVDEPTQAELAYGAHTGNNGMWLAVLEKAYGKYEGKRADEKKRVDADNIGDGGDSVKAHKILTGKDAKWDYLPDVSKEETHRQLDEAMREGRPVTAGIRKETGEDWGLADGKSDAGGLDTDHEYTVTKYDPEKKLVTVRNPWGHGEPKDADGNAKDGKNDGEVTMTLDEFYKNFHDVTYTQR